MKRLPLLLLAAALCLHAADYEISDYTATFTVSEGSADVAVRLDVTYRIFNGTKSDGFKYVGKLEPYDVRGVDDHGSPIEAEVNGHEVRWHFPETGPGETKVTITFKLRDALKDSRSDGNVLDLDWVGVFASEVRKTVYRIDLPDAMYSQIRMSPTATATSLDGNKVLTAVQEPLRDRVLWVKFAPGVVDSTREFGTTENLSTQAVTIVLMFGGLGVVLAIATIVFAMARNGNWKRAFRSHHYGGGCGGGGCGGGCGGS